MLSFVCFLFWLTPIPPVKSQWCWALPVQSRLWKKGKMWERPPVATSLNWTSWKRASWINTFTLATSLKALRSYLFCSFIIPVPIPCLKGKLLSLLLAADAAVRAWLCWWSWQLWFMARAQQAWSLVPLEPCAAVPAFVGPSSSFLI